jgi:hypothetical protein
MENSNLDEVIQDFRNESQQENLLRLKTLATKPSWLQWLIPRFSLLTLLLLVMLFGLGAAYVSLKRSTMATIDEKDKAIRFHYALGMSDRELVGNRLKMGSLDLVELHRLEGDYYVGYQDSSVRFIRTKPVEVPTTKTAKEFYQLWNSQQVLNRNGPTELFSASDRQSNPENQSGLLIWIEEIKPEAIRTLPNRVLFNSRADGESM